jgi:PAS domain S-box-containing protein
VREPDYKSLFESATGLYLVLDPHLRIAAASDAYLRATMTRRENILGKGIFEVFPGEGGQAGTAAERDMRAFFERMFATGKAEAIPFQKYSIPRPSHLGGGFEERYWSVLGSPVPAADGSVGYLIASVEDVTVLERLKAGEAAGQLAEAAGPESPAIRLMREALESEARYRRLFNSIDAGFCVIEMIYDAGGKPVDYRFLEVNPAFERQTGLEDATGKTMREHVPEHEQHWFDTYARIAETGEPVRFVNEAKPLMGGWYEVYAFRVGDRGSRRVAVLFNDITERVRAEQSLKDADRRKDEFLATLAHELRNPLAPIRSALDLLRLMDAAAPELRMARDVIDRQVDQLVRLVDDLLDVSRITFGKVQLRREPIDLRSVAEDALATSKPLLQEAGHRLSVRLPPAPLLADGDAMRLSQVISNLLNNAARYTPHPGEIALEASMAGDEAVITVQDNGVGIPREMLSRVFEPFMQVGQPGGTMPAGIGIGLSLAKLLVELHGGTVRAESEGGGKGSRFEVRLPLAAVPGATRLPAGTADRAVLRRRFLLVDDNVDAADAQAALLRMHGHEVETAHSGEEALKRATQFCPEVVLLDLGMPGMDGFEVARRLRQTPVGRGAVLIAQTGWGQEQDRERTAAAGFDAHLAKPVELRALMEKLASTTPGYLRRP